MTLEKRLKEIRKFCQANANPTLVRKYARFFVEGYDAYGLDRQVMEAQRDIWLKKWDKELGFDGFLKLGDLLIKSGKFEEGSYAILFIMKFRDQFDAESLERLGSWLEHGLGNWAHTDTFSSEVLSTFLTRKLVRCDAFSSWRTSTSKWKRRAVPVTLIKLLKTEVEVSALLDFLAPMMLDSEKVVRQGLGWFLREAWKRDPERVEGFLRVYKDTCGRLIIQYATEKMTPERKALFRKEEPKTKARP